MSDRSRWRLWHKHQSMLYALHPDQVPAESVRLTYTFGLGGISVLATLIAVVTGVLLTFYYTPTVDQAYPSVTLLQDVVAFGSLIRARHYWSAQLLVVTVTLHLVRIVFTGAFGRPRRVNWLIGLGLLVLVLFWSFSGYALRWDESALWALLVGTNLIKEIPRWGTSLYLLLMGDEQVGPAALLRSYGWHVIGLTLTVVFGIIYHLFRLRKDGSISRPPTVDGEARHFVSKDLLFFKEIVTGLLVFAALILLSSLLPAPLGGPAQLDQPPTVAQAPWFFLWVQELLRWLPALWAGSADSPLALAASGLDPLV
ncbi:MAG: cytochrome b N-terminal domain-containing protein [Caldilineaceae bacterium]